MSIDSNQTSPLGAQNAAPTPARPPQAAGVQKSACIGLKSKFKGDIESAEDLHVDGHFTGTLDVVGHQLSVGNQGQVKGMARAKIIIIEGAVEGDLYAIERIVVKAGATVKGGVYSPRVSLEEGGRVCGMLEMDPEAVKTAMAEKFGATATTATATVASQSAEKVSPLRTDQRPPETKPAVTVGTPSPSTFGSKPDDSKKDALPSGGNR